MALSVGLPPPVAGGFVEIGVPGRSFAGPGVIGGLSVESLVGGRDDSNVGETQ